MTSQVSNRTKPAAARVVRALAEDVAGQLGVDVAGGLSAAKAAERLQQNGPNALPAEKTVPGWRRFVEQYRSCMQIILLIAAVVSFAIGQWRADSASRSIRLDEFGE
jgi:P-type Ca2+ transporter type 2C